MNRDDVLHLHLRSQGLRRDAGGRNYWKVIHREKRVPASRTAIVICDMWDTHWSRGATERVGKLVPRINETITAARERGVRVIHAPSDTMAFYEGTPARQRMLELPQVDTPAPLDHPESPLPVDASDHGSDTDDPVPEEKRWPWTREHPAIEIDQERDGVSESGEEIYSFLRHYDIETYCIMGVHLNMCVLDRPFGIKQMVKWGVNVVLARDLTDAMYNPAMPPYVSHEDGTHLVADYVEKFWCPTMMSEDFRQPAGRD